MQSGQRLSILYNIMFSYRGAILSLNRQLAIEYGRHNVRSNAVCPGTIATPLVQNIIEKRAG